MKSRTKPGISEIVVDGLTYEVSTSSIIDGVYHQGLDSVFLVGSLRYPKK